MWYNLINWIVSASPVGNAGLYQVSMTILSWRTGDLPETVVRRLFSSAGQGEEQAERVKAIIVGTILIRSKGGLLSFMA